MFQVEFYLKDKAMAGPAYAWRWPDGGRRCAVARWTRRRAAPAYALIPDPILIIFCEVTSLGPNIHFCSFYISLTTVKRALTTRFFAVQQSDEKTGLDFLDMTATFDRKP